MAVAAEPMPGNAVIPATTNVTEAFSADRGDGSNPIANIRGAIDRLGGKEFTKKETKTESRQEPQAPPEIPFVDKSGKAKEEEATTEVADDAPTETSPETPEEKEARNWGQTKKELKQAKKELEELRAKAADLEKYTKEIEDYKQRLSETEKERNEYNEELYMTRVEKTAEYKKFITEPLAKIESQAELLAERNKLDVDALKKALHDDAKGNTAALDEILGELPDREKQRIYGLSDQLLTIADRQADIHQNSKLAYEAAVLKEQERSQQETQKAIQAREAVIQKLIPKLTSEIIDKMPEDKRPDMDMLSKEVMNVNQWPEELKVYGGVASAVLPYIIDDNKALRSEVEALKQANSKLRGGAPSTANGRTPSAPAEIEKAPNYREKKSNDFIKEMVGRIGAR